MYRGNQATEIRLRFGADVAARIAERTWHRSQVVRPLAGGGLELTLKLDGVEELLPFVLSYGASVQVMAPPELATRIAAAHHAATSLYIAGRRPARRAPPRPSPRKIASR